jgi:hypothetical protein
LNARMYSVQLFALCVFVISRQLSAFQQTHFVWCIFVQHVDREFWKLKL